jgi:hypothetical protein
MVRFLNDNRMLCNFWSHHMPSIAMSSSSSNTSALKTALCTTETCFWGHVCDQSHLLKKNNHNEKVQIIGVKLQSSSETLNMKADLVFESQLLDSII